MAIHRTPEEMLRHHTNAMGKGLGPIFNRLWNDAAWLHLKWNEFVKLFAKSPAQMRELNTAAPGFFHQVQELWWDDLLLHISRITENRKEVLSVYTLLRMAPLGLKNPIQAHIDTIKKATAFARDARNQNVAHRNLDVAMGVSALTLGSRNDVRAAIRSIDDLLHFVEHHFLKTEPLHYEYLENLGGVDSLLDIIDRGLRDRDRQFGYHRQSHPPDSD